MVRLNNFELNIVRTDGSLFPTRTEDDNVYVEVPHETQYKIEIKSLYQSDANANIHVDGQSIGTFRLYPSRPVIIERAAGVNRCFMFCHEDKLRSDTDLIGKQQNGLISVDFVAENVPIQFPAYVMNTSSQLCSTSLQTSSLSSSGFTMLGPPTSQFFEKVKELDNLDENSKTRIVVRLIGPAENKTLKPLQRENNLHLLNQMNDPPRIL